MKMPKKLMIKGSEWKVIERVKIMLGQDECDGLCDFEAKKIFIRKEATPSEKAAALIHETLHAALRESHISGNVGWVDPLVEDVLCDALAEVLLSNFTVEKKKRGR
jgi:hypothetical protein